VLKNNTFSPQNVCMGLDGTQKKQRLFSLFSINSLVLLPNVYYAYELSDYKSG
jgi:hypothetical protein